MAFEPERAVGELEEAAPRDGSCAVEDEVAAGEAGVQELVIVAGGEGCKVEDHQEEEAYS